MRNAGNPELVASLSITIILVTVLVGVAYLIVWSVHRRKARLEPPEPAPIVARASGAPKPAPAWVWLLLVLMIAGLFRVFVPINKRGRAAPPPSPAANWICAAVAAVPVIYVVVAIARVWLTHRDPDVKDANLRAQAGDVDGAMLDLERAIAAKGPSANRLNGLGLLRAGTLDWPAALPLFREASALAPKRLDIRNNLGIALLKNDDPVEAAAVLSDAVVRNPNKDPVHLTNHALALIALGWLDEAGAQIEAAQAALNNTKYLSTQDIRGQIQAAIDEARVKLAEAWGNKAKVTFDEL